MNIIEQRIRMYIRKQLMLEGVGVSGYDIKIPGTMLIGDTDDGLKRWRVERINQQAKENGCIRGFLIIATNQNKSVKDKSTDKKKSNAKTDPNRKKTQVPFDRNNNANLEKVSESLLIQDITTTIQSIETYAQYYGTDYRIVLSNPIQRGKRKIFAAWIVDMNTTEPTPFRQLLNKIQDIQSNTEFKISVKAKQYFIGTSTEIITQSNAIAWTKSIADYLEKLKKTMPNTYKDEFPDTEVSYEQLDSIPDFTKMNRITIPAETYDADIKTGLVDIDHYWLYKYGFSAQYQGTAIVSNDPVTGQITIQPVYGSIVTGMATGDETGIFTGDFKDGAPYKGTIEFSGKLNDDGEATFTNDDITKFVGEFDPTIYTINQDTGPTSFFNLTKVKGIQYYYKKNDPEAKYFDGTFTNGVVNNGSVWKRKNSSSPYDTKIGNYINGKYVAIIAPIELKPVTYPHLIKNKGSLLGQTVYTSSDKTLSNYVYMWVQNKNEWNQILKSEFEQYVNGQITEVEFLKKITSITDATVAAQLSTEFKKGTSYVEVNTTKNIICYDSKGNALGEYDQYDADQKKLIWTGITATGKKWYSVYIKDNKGKIMPDAVWIKGSLVVKEIPYGQ